MDKIQQVAVLKRTSHDGMVQWVLQEYAHKDDAGNVFDIILCSWCGRVPFMYDRRLLAKCLKGVDNRKLPNCGCRKLDTAAIARDYMTDMTIEEICTKYDVSHATVVRAARDAGIRRKPPKKNTTTLTDYRILSEILLTASTAQIASKLGCSKERVRKAVNALMTAMVRDGFGR